jgi:hypothetical protein
MQIKINNKNNSRWANYKPCTLSATRAFRDSFVFCAVDILLCLLKNISTLAINFLHHKRLRFYVGSIFLPTTSHLFNELNTNLKNKNLYSTTNFYNFVKCL